MRLAEIASPSVTHKRELVSIPDRMIICKELSLLPQPKITNSRNKYFANFDFRINFTHCHRRIPANQHTHTCTYTRHLNLVSFPFAKFNYNDKFHPGGCARICDMV